MGMSGDKTLALKGLNALIYQTCLPQEYHKGQSQCEKIPLLLKENTLYYSSNTIREQVKYSEILFE